MQSSSRFCCSFIALNSLVKCTHKWNAIFNVCRWWIHFREVELNIYIQLCFWIILDDVYVMHVMLREELWRWKVIEMKFHPHQCSPHQSSIRVRVCENSQLKHGYYFSICRSFAVGKIKFVFNPLSRNLFPTCFCLNKFFVYSLSWSQQTRKNKGRRMKCRWKMENFILQQELVTDELGERMKN